MSEKMVTLSFKIDHESSNTNVFLIDFEKGTVMTWSDLANTYTYCNLEFATMIIKLLKIIQEEF